MHFPSVRRAHVAALFVLVALFLLLLARLPPPTPPPSPPQLLQQPRASSALTSPPANRTTPDAPSAVVSSSAVAVAGVASGETSSVRAAVSASAGPRAVLTREVYVAGHEWPHPELCPALGSRVQLLVLVTSAPSHAQARDAVRLTWGHYAKRADVAIAFVVGQPPPALRPALTAEDALYGDIVLGRFQDSYSNLTLKTLSMLEWVDTYCPRARRLLKTDDDMFINVPRLLQFASAPARINSTKTIWGKVVKRWTPKRAPSSKYYVSPLQYPAREYPEFATGPAYLVSRDAVAPLLAAAPDRAYLRLEDVFVTGVLAASVGVRRVHAAEFYNRKVTLHPCVVQRGVAVHMVRYHEQFDLWRKLLDGKAHCAR